MAFGKAQYLLQRDLGREEADIQAKSKKRGLWSKIGMGLGGLLAMGLTAGTAAPVIAGLMAAGGSYVGGKLGDVAAKEGWFRSGKAKIKGKGKFFQDQRGGIVSRIGEDILAGSLKAGLGATFAAAGGLKGLTAKGEGGLGQIFKRGTGGQTEGFGKLFDLKGSPIGRGVEKIGKGFAERKAAKAFDVAQQGMPSSEYDKFIDIGQYAERAESAEISAGLKDYQFGPDRRTTMWDETDPLAVPGSRDMPLRDLTTAKRNLMDARPEGAINRSGIAGSGTDYTSNFPVGESADIVKDQGLIGPSEYTPFDRSSMLKRQAGARFQGTRDTPTGVSGSGTDYTSNFPVGEGADVIRDPGLDLGTSGTSFDRGSMLNRQAMARYQGTRGIPEGISGSGTDFTGTSALEGVGESFPVTSPDMVGDIGEAYTQSPEYDYKSVLDKKRQGRLETLQWQDRLFGR